MRGRFCRVFGLANRRGDIFLPGTGLTAGLGWLPLDTFRGRGLRRLTGFAELIVTPCGGQGVLYLTVVPGALQLDRRAACVWWMRKAGYWARRR